MCVWQELPGYDPEYTETDRKDIQNLAKEIETSYARYGGNSSNYLIIIIIQSSVPELRKDIEYETDENIPSCCLAMCLDWFLQKIGCRASQEVGNTDHEVYGRNDQERF